jgi:hypothetical protein
MTPLYITPRRSIGPVISRFDDGRATMLEIATDDPCEHPGYGTIEWAPVPPLLARRGALHPLVGLPGARWRVTVSDEALREIALPRRTVSPGEP